MDLFVVEKGVVFPPLRVFKIFAFQKLKWHELASINRQCAICAENELRITV